MIPAICFASNNDLTDSNGNLCTAAEQTILNGGYDATIDQSIQDCLHGDTYSYNSHGFKNFIFKSNETPTLEKDGKIYHLEAFSSIESMNQRIKIINYKIAIEDYQNCNINDQAKQIDYAKSQAIYSEKLKEYLSQLKAYKQKNVVYQRKYNAAKKVNDQLYVYAMNLCMNGGLVNGYGVPVPKIGCSAYSKAYVMTDLAPEYNYRNNGMLDILYQSKEQEPVSPTPPLSPVAQNCGAKPILIKAKSDYTNASQSIKTTASGAQ